MGAIQQFLSHIPKTKTQSHLIASAVAGALIGRGRGEGVYSYIGARRISFEISCLVGQNTNI